MGCCSSGTASEIKARLDKVEQDVSAHKSSSSSADASVHLDVMGASAKEIKEVMNLLIQDGAKDKLGMQRVEKLSDVILDNLRSRINTTLLKQAASQKIVDQILAVARDLDAVRSSRASTELQRMVDKGRAALEAAEEHKATATVTQVAAIVDKIKEPNLLIPGITRTLELVEKIHSDHPDCQKVTDKLLQNLVGLSNRVLNMQAAWVVDPEAVKLVKTAAEKLDGIAAKLVVVMESKWDPPLTGQVEHISNSYAKKFCAAQLATAEKELSSSNGGAAYDSLESLVPWWPSLHDSGGLSLQLVGVFSKVYTFAKESFKKAGDAGDKATADSIREFATKFDALRTKFEGLPPAAHAGLGEELAAAEIVAAIKKQIQILNAEVAKAFDDDKSTNLSLATTVQTLEALVGLWPSRPSSEESLVESLEAACTSVEKWADQAAKACAASKVDSLMKFADEYDKRRLQLVPPELKSSSLRSQISAHVVRSHLKTLEVELGKKEGLNPNTLLDELKNAGAAMPQEDVADELKTRLSSAFDMTEKRVVEKYVEAIQSHDSRKRVALQHFATKFDAVRSECLIGGIEDAVFDSSLAAKLQEEAGKGVQSELDTIDVELEKTTGLNLSQVLRALKALETLLPQVPDSPERDDKLVAMYSKLEERLAQLCDKLCADGDMGKASKLLSVAGDIDGSIAKLRTVPEGEESQKLRTKIAGPVVEAHMTKAQSLLKIPEAMDLDALSQELVSAQRVFQEGGCPQESVTRMNALLAALEDPLVGRLVAADADAKVGASVAMVAEAADDAYAAVNGSSPEGGGLQKKVASYKPVVEKLQEAHAELAKTNGMNPKLVLQVLQALQPLWSIVAESSLFRDNLSQALVLFRERLSDACQKALEGEEAKLTALLTFAREVDKAQEALASLSDGLAASGFHQALSLTVSDAALKNMEQELAKESGLNSAVVLKSAQDISRIWSDIQGTAAVDEAADAAASEFRIRFQEAHELVRKRMQESMLDAVATNNTKKQEALLKFAGDFDGFRQVASALVDSAADTIRNSLEAAQRDDAEAATNAVADNSTSGVAPTPAADMMCQAPPAATAPASRANVATSAPPRSTAPAISAAVPTNTVSAPPPTSTAPPAKSPSALPPAATVPASRPSGEAYSSPPRGSV